jgi:hypothetical protein
MLTAPGSASFAKGGGGGTPAPAPGVPTISVSSSLIPGQSPLVGQAVNVFVIATSESGNRKAPTVNAVATPGSFTLQSIVSVDSPHGGGPGYVQATYAWTPTRDQIGLVASLAITATSSGGTGSATLPYAAVLDAPSAVTGLAATHVDDHIEVTWTPSTGGTGTVSYAVKACYRNANIREVASTCDLIGTTTNAALDIPAFNPTPTVAPAGGIATYIAVLVTPIDAAGISGPPVSAVVQ